MDVGTKSQMIRSSFPVFKQFELVEMIAEKCTYIKVPKDTVILDVGNYIKVIPLVISGAVKVFREDADAREAFLYYITSGQSCALTLAASLKPGKSKVKAITLEETEILALDVDSIYDVNKKFPSWFSFVFETFGNRFEELLSAFEGVVFLHLDSRLENYLKQRSETVGTKQLKISHIEIARDLATSREVVSRLLKQMEKESLLLLSRGQITLL